MGSQSQGVCGVAGQIEAALDRQARATSGLEARLSGAPEAFNLAGGRRLPLELT